MATDWLIKLGRKGFEALVSDIMNRVMDRALGDRVEPRLAAIESRMSGLENTVKGLDYKVDGVIERLNVTERLVKLEAEMAVLKAKS